MKPWVKPLLHVYLKTIGVTGTTNWGLILGPFLSTGQPSETLDAEEHVDDVEDVDMFLSRADFLTDSLRSRFLKNKIHVHVILTIGFSSIKYHSYLGSIIFFILKTIHVIFKAKSLWGRFSKELREFTTCLKPKMYMCTFK